MKSVVVLVMGAAMGLGGRANPVASNYVASNVTSAAGIPRSQRVEVRWVKDLEREGAARRAAGWQLMGSSSFSEVAAPGSWRIETQARRVGADVVLAVASRGRRQTDDFKLTQFDDRQPVYPQTSTDPHPPSRVVETTVSASYQLVRFNFQFWRKNVP